MKDILKALVMVIGGLIFVVLGAWLSDKFRDNSASVEPVLTPVTRPPMVNCPPDFLSYRGLIENSDRVVKLIDAHKTMFAANGEFVNSQVIITKSETKESKLACGYLFIRAGTSKGSLQSWENIYINPNEFGGHIDSKEQIGPGDGNHFSEYLFPLSQINYWKTRSERVKRALSTADWAALLNVSEKVLFITALNTEDKSGFIDELSIAYKCWNPATGTENKNCKLSITDKSDTQSNVLK